MAALNAVVLDAVSAHDEEGMHGLGACLIAAVAGTTYNCPPPRLVLLCHCLQRCRPS